MEAHAKACSRCQKFKSQIEFYKQGSRLESVCKICKREVRYSKKRARDVGEKAAAEIESLSDTPGHETAQNPQTPEDLGFTKEEFLEVVEFFKELLRLNRKGRTP